MSQSCKTCSFWIYLSGKVNGERKEWPACAQHSGYFPKDGAVCTLWLRCVGGDDE